MKKKLCWSAAIFLFCLLYFIPSKVGADTGVDILSKCTSLKNQGPDKSWNKFRAGKDKFKASRRRKILKNTKKTDEFSRGYCLGYITASANALSVFSPEKFCPPKNMTKGELSATVIEYISENHLNSLKLRANQLVSRALLKKFACR
jgi:hypothetical protein